MTIKNEWQLLRIIYKRHKEGSDFTYGDATQFDTIDHIDIHIKELERRKYIESVGAKYLNKYTITEEGELQYQARDIESMEEPTPLKSIQTHEPFKGKIMAARIKEIEKNRQKFNPNFKFPEAHREDEPFTGEITAYDVVLGQLYGVYKINPDGHSTYERFTPLININSARMAINRLIKEGFVESSGTKNFGIFKLTDAGVRHCENQRQAYWNAITMKNRNKKGLIPVFK